MANSSTALDPIRISIGSDFTQLVTPYVVVYDTPSADLIIAAPSSAIASVGIVGIDLVSSTAFNLTIKSDSTDLAVLQFAANSGWSMSIGNKVKQPTQAGEDLVFNCDAALPTFTVYVLEFESLNFSTQN